MKKRIFALFAAAAMIFTMAGTAFASDEAPSAEASAEVSADTGYEDALFDTSYIHEVDITISEEDWDYLLENAMEKPKSYVTVSVDGEVYENVRFSPKGNGSLAMVSMIFNNDRYSFKLNFSAADESQTYHGLDQFVLNNSYYDNSYLRDYACAWLYRQMGIPTELMSFTKLYINGEFYGVYMAEESPEEAFIDREFGGEGVMYKPSSSVLEANDSDFFMQLQIALAEGTLEEVLANIAAIAKPLDPDYTTPGADLKYTDDAPESYTDIIDNEITDITDADVTELITALKNLSEGNADAAIDTDEVIRYFAVHNFVVNTDGYTGLMLHNYILHENNGILTMVPWDYNNAMEPMRYAVTGGTDENSWTEIINMGIDSPTFSEVALEDRPMLNWIFEDDDAYAAYTDAMEQIIALVQSGEFEAEMQRMYEQIRPYVAEDPTAFCTLEEFDESYQDVINFCELRAESLQKQIDGELASVTADQDPAERIHYKDGADA